MQKKNVQRSASGHFDGIGFSPRFKALLEARAPNYTSRDASVDELIAKAHDAYALVPNLAGIDVLLDLRKHNPAIFQIIEERDSGRPIGFNALLPLTSAGVEAVLDGTFDPAAPMSEFIAQSHETVTEIYSWLIFGERTYVPTIAGLADYIHKYAPDGCAVFCRAAHEHAAAIFKKAGYEPAALSYANAPDDLLMVHRVAPSPPEPEIKVEIVRSLDDFLRVLSVRASTYIAEQECPFDEDYDGNDFCSSHLLATVNGEPAGCLRIRYFKQFVKFERLAVRREFRTSKIAFRLVREAMRFVSRKGFDRVYGHARHDLVRFWQTFGFRPIPDRPKFVFSDIEFVEMEGPVPSVSGRISPSDPPHHILRPEGLWDEPSIFERETDPDRFNRIEQRLQREKA